jgi:hypothetical protein
MEPQINEPESVIAPLRKVTPLSKYLALALFIIMPFLGVWVGFNLASEEIQKVENPLSTDKEITNSIEVNEVVSKSFREVVDENYTGDTKWNDLMQEPAISSLQKIDQSNVLSFYEATKDISLDKTHWENIDTGLGFQFFIPRELLEFNVEPEVTFEGIKYIPINIDFSSDYYLRDENSLLQDVIFTQVFVSSQPLEELIQGENYFFCKFTPCEGRRILSVIDFTIEGQPAKYVIWNYDGSSNYFTPSSIPMNDVHIQLPSGKTLSFMGPEGDVGKFVNHQIGDIFLEVVNNIKIP